MIDANISQHILTIGESYKNHKGGIAGVINTYSRYFYVFKFIPTYKSQPNKLFTIPYFLLSLFLLVQKLLFDSQIRVVHIHGAARGSILRKYIVFLITHYLFKRKVIYHCHGSEFEKFYNQCNYFFKIIISSFMNRVDLIICLSEQWRFFFLSNFKTRDIIILENIIEPALEQKKILGERKQITALFLGRIGSRKGIFDLLNVIVKHKNELAGQLQLVIGGNGEVRKLEDFINKHRLQSLVRYEGWVTGIQKQKLLSECDFYILPSYNEGLPLSILEAMSYNLPVISTPVGGISEIVQDNINGFLVTPGDCEAIYDRIKRFLDNPELLTTMGKASSDIITPYYADAVIPKLRTIYKTMIK